MAPGSALQAQNLLIQDVVEKFGNTLKLPRNPANCPKKYLDSPSDPPKTSEHDTETRLPYSSQSLLVKTTEKAPENLLDFCSKGDIQGVDEESRKEGVDPNMQDAEGNTPLILASQAGFTAIVEMLISRFHNYKSIRQGSADGQSALMKAAIQGRVTCARALLRAGQFNFLFREPHGTPTVQPFFAGADPSLRDFSRGFCALDWAEYVGRSECMHIIAHYMMKPTKAPRAPFTSMISDLQKMTAAATIPVLGETVDTLVPIPRPRVGSAPIPRLEITVAPDQHDRVNIG
ncbi:ankyrin repeat protein [Ancylostoma duodenale]|uniref:Ankyrin repeat protein n=1 Tax=Ancylostoma duodenale TaxID=51022 RepID=A0A0C2G4Q1_9BILA|nr:ankyrin repeat protein [Ancylostoma duodenale]